MSINMVDRPWTKLHKAINNLMIPEFDIHIAVYSQHNHKHHGNELPRYFVTFGKDIIWDYPAMFSKNSNNLYSGEVVFDYPWDKFAQGGIADFLSKYVNLSRSEIVNYSGDTCFGLFNILRACDKRVGKRTLDKLKNTERNIAISRIIVFRLNDGGNYGSGECN